MPLLHRSITDLKESELISRVLNDPHYRTTVFHIRGLQTHDAQILEHVDLRLFGSALAGDVDILVIPQDHPEESTAIQVKRFQARVRINGHGDDEIAGGSLDRFRKLMSKGIDQTNLITRVGFAQVYLWIFVAIDTRERNSGWNIYDGPDAFLRSSITSALSQSGLGPTIGLMEFQWVQPMDRPPFELVTHGGSLWKLAAPTRQPAEVTGRLRGLSSPMVAPRSGDSYLACVSRSSDSCL